MKSKRFFPIVFIFLSAIPTPLGNFVSITEVLAGFYLLLKGRIDESMRKMFLFGAISCAGIAISSLVHDDFSDYLGSVWRIISILILSLFFLQLTSSNIVSVRLLLLITSIVYASSVISFAGDLFPQNAWKYGLGTPIITILLILTTYFNMPFIVRSILPFLLALISLRYDSRGLALICLFTSISCLTSEKKPATPAYRKVKLRSILSVFALVILSSQLAISAYSHQVLKGTFGIEQRTKWIAQNSSGFQNFLFVARPELPVSLCILKDSLLIGRGSSVNIPRASQEYCVEFASKLGVYLNSNEQMRIFPNSTQFNAHSIIFIYLAKGGIAGGIFWLYLLYLVGQFLLRFFGSYRVEPAYIFMGLSVLNDLLVSPFTERTNLIWATLIVAIFELRKKHEI